MPRGDKDKYTDKQKRKAEHIAEGYEERGISAEEAKSRAWATVNKESGGGNESGSGRGVEDTTESSERGGRIGGRTKRAGAKRAGTNRASTKRAGTKRASTKRASTKRAGTRRASTRRASTKRAGTKRTSTKRTGTKRGRAKRSPSTRGRRR